MPLRPCTYPPVTVARSLSNKLWSRNVSYHGWVHRQQQRRRQLQLIRSHRSSLVVPMVDPKQPPNTHLFRSTSCTTTTVHSPGSFAQHTIATISSLTTSIPSSPQSSSRPSSHPSRPFSLSTYPPLPVFHTQSLLFLFGFLFLPCWWIGAFWYPHGISPEPGVSPAMDEEGVVPSLIVVHPSMFANGRAVSHVLISPAPPIKKPSRNYDHLLALERESRMYHRWNRIMSVASIGILATVISMLAWYQLGYRGSPMIGR